MLAEVRDYTASAIKGDTVDVIKRFTEEIDNLDAGLSDRLAAMEHNRWMAERLAYGWRYGPRSDGGRRRTTFLAWEHLTEGQRLYDSAHLPRLILEAQNALWEPDSGTLYYLRKEPLVLSEAHDVSL